MKAPSTQQPRMCSRRFTARDRRLGFTLLEMLFVVLIISILALLLLPVLSKAKARAHSAACSSQLRQVGFAMHEFSHDHLDQFPFQVPTNQGGSLEFARAGFAMSGEFFFAYRHLQLLSNTLATPRMLRCPTDLRLPAQNFSVLQNSNLSYFVATSAEYSQPESILCGDRNISGQSLASGSIVRVGTNSPVVWTSELHQFKGNLLFADSHVAQVNNAGLGGAVYASGTTVGYILPPVTPPPGIIEDNGTSIFLAVKEAMGSPTPSTSSTASQDDAGGSSKSPDPVQPVVFRDKAPPVADVGISGVSPEPGALPSRHPGRSAPTVSVPAAPDNTAAATTNLAAKGGMNPLKRVTTGTPAATPILAPEVQSKILEFAQHPEQHQSTWLLLLLFVTVAAFFVGRHLHRRRQRRLGVA